MRRAGCGSDETTFERNNAKPQPESSGTRARPPDSELEDSSTRVPQELIEWLRVISADVNDGEWQEGMCILRRGPRRRTHSGGDESASFSPFPTAISTAQGSTLEPSYRLKPPLSERIQWTDISSSIPCCCVSHVQLFATPRTVAYPAPVSKGFHRQTYWRGLSFLSPGDLPGPGIEVRSPAWEGRFFTTEPPGKSIFFPCIDTNLFISLLLSMYMSVHLALTCLLCQESLNYYRFSSLVSKNSALTYPLSSFQKVFEGRDHMLCFS